MSKRSNMYILKGKYISTVFISEAIQVHDVILYKPHDYTHLLV